jgi:hypothetical protein
MEQIIAIGYEEMFDEPIPDLDSLMTDFPSEQALMLLSQINSQLYYADNFDSQIAIFGRLLPNQSEQTRKKFERRITNIYQKNKKVNKEISFFSIMYSLDFMHYVLNNFNQLDSDHSSSELELNFLKAYFVIVEKAGNLYQQAQAINEVYHDDLFAKNTWPSLINQFEVGLKVNHVVVHCKGLMLLHFLNKTPDYKKYVERFLQKNDKIYTTAYLDQLMLPLLQAINRYEPVPGKLFPFELNSYGERITLIEKLAVSPGHYMNRYGEDKRVYTGFKEKPLYKLKNGNFIVLNWNFFITKMYEGLIFDFYEESGIAERTEFNERIKFKRYISSEIIEKHGFRKIIPKYFPKKNTVILFDDNSSGGLPDAYVRDNNNIFLFEIKDALFPIDTINSLSTEKIEVDLNKKFNSDNKGTGQIISQINKLSTDKLFNDNLEQKGIKKNNIRIYPIIVYTDIFYNLPGFNAYLKKEFNQRLNKTTLRSSFKKIENITFINYSFLLQNLVKFNKQERNLQEVIVSYHNVIEKRIQKYKVEPSPNNFIAMYDPVEEFFRIKYDSLYNLGLTFEKIVQTLELRDAFPPDDLTEDS